ncbi:MAG: uroporphyrinogen-III C-methyltransferase [Caldimonas sp.]
MNDDLSPAAEVPAVALATARVPPPPRPLSWRWQAMATLLVALVAVLALVFAWRADQRVRSTERELVKRQQDSADRVAEATLLARQAQDSMREATAKVALLEARLNEIAVQRDQLEDLIQSVARSRDENLVVDIESAMRAAMQQSALTGSAEPLVAALKQSDDRLARANQLRLEPVRRAIARDLVRVKAASVADVASLSIKVDEVVRMIDELPLLAAAEPRRDFSGDVGKRARPFAAAAPAASASASASPADGIDEWIARGWDRAGRFFADNVWTEMRSLVRITRIDQPEAMLVAPDQAFFLRENLKLRLLNARLALLARQFEAAQSDLKWSESAIERYFDRSSKRTQIAVDLLRQVSQQSHQAGVIRPDDTLAALATASAAR